MASQFEIRNKGISQKLVREAETLRNHYLQYLLYFSEYFRQNKCNKLINELRNLNQEIVSAMYTFKDYDDMQILLSPVNIALNNTIKAEKRKSFVPPIVNVLETYKNEFIPACRKLDSHIRDDGGEIFERNLGVKSLKIRFNE